MSDRNTGMSKLIQIIQNLGIEHRSDEGFLLIGRDSLMDHFPGDEGTLPEERRGSYGKAKNALEKEIGARIMWSKYDDDWLGVDKVVRNNS